MASMGSTSIWTFKQKLTESQSCQLAQNYVIFSPVIALQTEQWGSAVQADPRSGYMFLLRGPVCVSVILEKAAFYKTQRAMLEPGTSSPDKSVEQTISPYEANCLVLYQGEVFPCDECCENMTSPESQMGLSYLGCRIGVYCWFEWLLLVEEMFLFKGCIQKHALY